MRTRLTRILVGLIVPLGVVFLYALVHEGGHALVVLLFGGSVTRFQVNFFTSAPQISYMGINDPMKRALISLGGPVLPLLLILPLTLFMRRTRSAFVQGSILLFMGSMLPTVLLSGAMAMAYGFGAVGFTEDIPKFILYSGFNPFAVALAFFLLLAAILFFLLRVGRAKDVAVNVVKTLRGTSDKRASSLLGRVLAAALLVAVGVSIVRNTVQPNPAVSQPLTYHTRIDVDLPDVRSDSSRYHTFEVQSPTTFDFVYSLTTQSDVVLRLINLDGEPFVFNNQDSIVMYQGSESLPLAYFTGFTLLEGKYALEVSPGSMGTLTMYIDSREPSETDLQYVELIAAVNDGTFTAQSYQEEGYELVYEGKVSEGFDQLLVTLPRGGHGRKLSAFLVGEADATVYYVADGKYHTILEGLRATFGRGLSPHRDEGEIRVTVQGGEAMLYIYVSESSLGQS